MEEAWTGSWSQIWRCWMDTITYKYIIQCWLYFFHNTNATRHCHLPAPKQWNIHKYKLVKLFHLFNMTRKKCKPLGFMKTFTFSHKKQPFSSFCFTVTGKGFVTIYFNFSCNHKSAICAVNVCFIWSIKYKIKYKISEQKSAQNKKRITGFFPPSYFSFYHLSSYSWTHSL